MCEIICRLMRVLPFRTTNAIFNRDASPAYVKMWRKTEVDNSSSQPNSKGKGKAVGSHFVLQQHNKSCSSLSSTNQKYTFEVKEGDLFSCPESWSLAHCISVDVRMGKGIAVLFKSKFKGIDEIKKQGAKVGGCAVLRRGSRFVYYLTTKEKFYEKPTYVTLQSSLKAMKKHIITNKVTHLAMPAIGCGLDMLSWPKVKDIIREEFHDVPVSITVFMIKKSQPKKGNQRSTLESFKYSKS